MQEILLIIFLVVAIALVGVILLQHGKGAGMGASFGAGASGTVFGAPGSGNVLTKVTTVLAIIFFGIALTLGYLANDASVEGSKDIFDQAEQQQTEKVVEPKTDIPATTAPQTESDIPAVAKPDAKEDKAQGEQTPAVEEKESDQASEKGTEEGDSK